MNLGNFKKFFFRRQVFTFIIVGFFTVLCDFIVYNLILSSKIFSIEICKGIGFVSGTIFSYLANRYWTFKYEGNILNKATILNFIIVYSFSLSVNILVNSLVINKLPNISQTISINIAFLIATLFSASLNFLGMKYFVFINKKI